MEKGLYTGRFQPFHLGHLHVVQQALEEVSFLYIGVGSSQSSHSKLNPFTFEEREEIIKKALREAGVSSRKYKLISIPDIHDNEAWPGYVQTIVPKFNRLFTGEHGIVKKLFKKHTIIPVTVAKRKKGISATAIRNAIRNDEKWEHFVSDSTAKFIKKMDVVKRIKHPTRSPSTRRGKLPIV